MAQRPDLFFDHALTQPAGASAFAGFFCVPSSGAREPGACQEKTLLGQWTPHSHDLHRIGSRYTQVGECRMLELDCQ